MSKTFLSPYNNFLKTINILSNKSYHTTSCCMSKVARVMNKVMGNSLKKKRNFSEAEILPTRDMLSKGSYEGRYSGNTRRTSVLNKLFMRHITDLIINGEYSREFLAHGIEINRVQISPDYKGLNVFWVAKGTPDDEVIDKLLKKNAGFLRHELSSLRVMGVVPMIHFVKDKKYSQMIEIDQKLAFADFGEGYVETELATKLKSKLELFIPLPNEIKNKIKELDEILPEDDSSNQDFPPMPQDVLGLNHAEILTRVKKSMKKSEALHRQNSTAEDITETLNENPIKFSSNKEQRAAFKSFLEKRELLRSKARKLDKNYLPDIEYMQQEFEDRREEYFRNMNVYEPERDIIEDDDCI